MVQNFLVKHWIAFPSLSHPHGRMASIHPNYFLLGFSAALAPKFHPSSGWEGQGGKVEDQWQVLTRLEVPGLGCSLSQEYQGY